MILSFIESTDKYRYAFAFDKSMKRKNKEVYSVHSDGILNASLKKFERIENAFEINFNVEEYNLQGVKEPIVFNPTKWIFDIDHNISYVRAKENLQTIWEKYKNKNRTQRNQAQLLACERLFFHVPNGFENSGFSNGPYLSFFVNYYNKDLSLDDLYIHNLDWLSIPSNLPLKITYRPKQINESKVKMEGWVTLNEEMLDFLLTKPEFRDRAMDYHFTKDFKINSTIDLIIDIKTAFMQSYEFHLEIDGTNGGLYESMKYKIVRKSSISKSLETDDTNIIVEEKSVPTRRWIILD